MTDHKNQHHHDAEKEEIKEEKNTSAPQPKEEEAQTAPQAEEQACWDGQEELEQLKEENKKLKEDYLRAYADAENTKRRCTQEIEKNNKYAISNFAKNLLSVADNLDRALKSIPEDKKDDCEHLKNLLTIYMILENFYLLL